MAACGTGGRFAGDGLSVFLLSYSADAILQGKKSAAA